jgi:hypothetical protein
LVVLLSVLLFSGSLLSFSDESGRQVMLRITGNLTDPAGLIISKSANMWPLIAILVLICLVSVITILLFRNRKYQLLLSKLILFLSAGLIMALAWYAFILVSAGKMRIIPGFKMALPVLILLFSFLAYRGILKDDRLVRSYDRLR